VYTVFASTDPTARTHGITCFLVEKDWGITFPKPEDKLGLRASPTGEVVFDNVRVPASHRIGNEGEGFLIAMHTLDRSRPTIGAQAVGIAQAAIDYAGDYMKGRFAFGKPIAELQGLRFMLADMAIRTEAARALVYRACATIDAGDPDDTLSYRSGREIVRVRHRNERHHRRGAVVGGLRLHQGVSGRAIYARRQNHADLRGDESDSTRGCCQAPLEIVVFLKYMV
jgi:alkylation response protein AidB-like acyl-CoA dehydrogenase